jgi:hypothetical protein
MTKVAFRAGLPFRLCLLGGGYANDQIKDSLWSLVRSLLLCPSYFSQMGLLQQAALSVHVRHVISR